MDTTKIKAALEGNLIEELGLTSLPEAEKLRLIESLTELVGVRTMARAGATLSNEDGEAFAKVVDSSSPDDVVDWLSEHNVDFQQLLVEEIGHLKQELKERAAKLDKI